MDAQETLVFIERTKEQIRALRSQLDAAAKHQRRQGADRKMPAELEAEVERLVAQEIAEVDDEISRALAKPAGALPRSPVKPVHRMV